MDYVTRQFINLAKHFRKDIRKALAVLSDALNNQTEAIREARKTADAQRAPQPEAIAVVNLPKSIEVHQSETDATHERQYKNRTVLVSALTLIAIVVYAVLVYMQYREMINATGAAQQSVVEARRNRIQSGKALDATIEQNRLDQRAWVGPVETAPAPYDDGGRKVYIKVGEKPKFAFLIANSGKTPALRFRSKIASHAYPSTETFVPYYETPKTVGTVGTLFPGVKMTLETLPAPGSAEQFHVNSLTTGDYIFYVYAEITYDDVFKHPHKTTFCVFVDKTLTQLLSCPTYNYSD